MAGVTGLDSSNHSLRLVQNLGQLNGKTLSLRVMILLKTNIPSDSETRAHLYRALLGSTVSGSTQGGNVSLRSTVDFPAFSIIRRFRTNGNGERRWRQERIRQR